MGEDEQTLTFSIKMPDGTLIPFSGTIESVEVADMERKVKPGDRIRIIKPWKTNGRYEKGDVLTVRKVEFAGVYVQENDWYIDENEYEIITDEIKPGDKVRLIDKPWEWDGWAGLSRERRMIYKGFMGKEHVVEGIINQPIVRDVQDYVCANIGRYYIIPLAMLRKVEPVRAEESKTDKASKSVFEAGKQYVFSRKLHSESSGDGWEWVRHVDDGAPVNFCPGTNLGNTGGFSVLRAWCREIPAKHRYTDEQITEAKYYLAESMVSMKDRWTITKPTEAHPVAVISGPLGIGTAKCAPDDEFNAYIGLMVAFKRYHGEPLPTWIRG